MRFLACSLFGVLDYGTEDYVIGVTGFHQEAIVVGGTKHLCKLCELPRSG
jgi:hypothetical protein